MTTIGKRGIPAVCSSPADRTEPAGAHREYRLRLATPMFGGGARAGHVDPRWPIRPSSIRGHLRFWWRLLHRDRFVSNGTLDAAAMRAREAEIWGSTEQPSAVQVRVEAASLQEDGFLGGDDRYGFAQLSPEAYALFPAIEGKIERIVKPGLEFLLHLSWPHQDELNRLRGIENARRKRSRQPLLPPTIQDFSPEVDAGVAAWIALGGVGARTRRGLGALEVVQATPHVVPFRLPNGTRFFTPTGGGPGTTAMSAWRQAVEVYQRFRQSFRGREHAKTGLSRPIPGRSHWPEPDSIRQMTGCALDDGIAGPPGTAADVNPHQHTAPIVTQAAPNFPRAVLGLPIGFHFAADGPGKGKPALPKRDPATVELVPRATDESGAFLDEEDRSGKLVPKAGDRMASPVITKPVWLDGRWQAAVVVLPHAHALKVHAVLKGKNARWDAARSTAVDLQQAVPNSQIVGPHLGALCPAAMADPMRGHANAIDALIAFLGRPMDGADPPRSKPVFVERPHA